jgi:hypothetical protein
VPRLILFLFQLSKALKQGKKQQSEFKCKTAKEFMAYARQCVEPAVTYYASHFKEGTELHKVKQGAIAAKVFDPRVLAKISIHACKLLLETLFANFKTPALSSQLYEQLVAELPLVSAAAKVPGTGLEFVDGAKEYDASTAAAAASKGDVPTQGQQPWETDMKESARRIWAWWKANYIAGKFPAWTKAVRIVALIPMSSAFVERVFSQAALIREIGGDSMLLDLFELRVMVRTNDSIPVTVSGV